MSRFGAVCGVIFGLSLGVAGVIEAFTGETAVTSFIVGVGVAGFGVPALFAFHLRQADASGRFGAVAAAVNIIGLGLFAGSSFAYNVVLFFVEPAVFDAVLDGPSNWVILSGGAIFIIGTLLFGASMVSTGVHPRLAAVGYTITLILLALLGNRRDGLISSARDQVEMYIEPDERLWLRKPNPSDEVFVPVSEEELSPGLKKGALERVAVGYPSTVMGLTPAVMLDPTRLLASARGFLRFVDEVYGYLGYLGPLRVEARVSGGSSYLAVPFPPEGAQRRFYRVSEQTELRSSSEIELQELAKREADLAEEILTRLAWHFGLKDFGL